MTNDTSFIDFFGVTETVPTAEEYEQRDSDANDVIEGEGTSENSEIQPRRNNEPKRPDVGRYLLCDKEVRNKRGNVIGAYHLMNIIFINNEPFAFSTSADLVIDGRHFTEALVEKG